MATQQRRYRQLFKAVAAVGLIAPMSHAATTGFDQAAGGTYDYNNSGLWVGGDINNTWHSSLVATGDQVLTFGVDTTLSSALTLDHSVTPDTNNVADITFRSDGTGDRTLTLGGGITFSPQRNHTFVIGSTVDGERLNLDLGGAARLFTIESGDTLTVQNNVSNGSLTVGGGTINLQGASNLGALTFTGGALNLSGVTTLGDTLVLAGGTTTVTNEIVSTTGINQTGGTANLNFALNYTGGTSITSAVMSVNAAGQLGANVVGNNVVATGSILNLAASTNLGANQTLTINSTSTTLGVLGVGYNGVPAFTQGGTGPIVLGINTTGFDAITSQASFGSGTNFFGSSASGTYAAATLGAGTDGIYRLGGGGGTLTITNAVFNSGQILVGSTLANGSGTVILQGANTTSGLVTVVEGTLQLAGSSGSLASAPIVVERDGVLNFNSGATGVAGATRAPSVTLNNGILTTNGNNGAVSVETVTGSITLTTVGRYRLPTITTNTGSRKNTLVAASLVRENNAIGLVRGANLGVNPLDSGAGTNFSLTSSPLMIGGNGAAGSTNISIIPWLLGGTNTTEAGSTFVTSSAANGVRPLTIAEYATAIGGNATDNVRLTANATIGSNATVNSLILVGNGTAANAADLLDGGGVLTVTSGHVLTGQNSNINAALDFGSAEGIIGWQRGGSMSGSVAGTGGLTLYTTRTGNDEYLTWNGASTYTGDTNILGPLYMSGSGVLPSGARTGNVNLWGALDVRTSFTINGLNGAGVLQGGGSGTTTLTLGDNNANGDFAGSISDFGTLNIVKIGGGTQKITGTTHTHKGHTTVEGGVLEVAYITDGGLASTIGDSSSAADRLVLNGGTLRYVGQATSSDRLFTVGASNEDAVGTIDASGAGPLTFTNANAIAYGSTGTTSNTRRRTLVLSGTNTGANTLSQLIGQNGTATNGNSDVNLIKSGAGRWVLSNANTYRGTTSINAGTLQVSAGGALGATASADVSVADGAVLQLDGNTAIDDSADLVLADGSTVILNGAGSESVNFLWLNGVIQSAGTYGATGSGAMFVNDDYFQGGGTITAVPEPAGLGLLAVAGAGLLRRRRRRAV